MVLTCGDQKSQQECDHLSLLRVYWCKNAPHHTIRILSSGGFAFSIDVKSCILLSIK